MHLGNAFAKKLPRGVQVIMFANKLSITEELICDQFLNNPVKIIHREEPTLKDVRHYYYKVDKELWKLDAISNIYYGYGDAPLIVFCASRRKAEWLAARLRKSHRVSCFHGDTSENRARVLSELSFSGGLLITSDLITGDEHSGN